MQSQAAFARFDALYGDLLATSLTDDRPNGRALVVSSGMPSAIHVEMALIKGLELAGYVPVVLVGRDRWLRRYYERLALVETVLWDDFLEAADPERVSEHVDDVQSLSGLVSFRLRGVRTGKYAASTALRYLRSGTLDMADPSVRTSVLPYLTSAVEYTDACHKLVAHVRPSVVLSSDPGYTPRGELFDSCLNAGVDTITWNAAHKSNALFLKRYRQSNRHVHFASLSDETWTFLKDIRWTDARRERLREELFGNYLKGEWYSEVGTQFNRRLLEAGDLADRLGLDPHKKTAAIFPHIFWDGTFFSGTDLFDSYEQWFLETVARAMRNDRVNWIIKVHPGNVVKAIRDGVQGEPSETEAIRRHFGTLPPHVAVIPADSDISTYSLFGLIDYCVTVRGTVGIEAATFGIPVLTAGTGRYDNKGFTIDSEAPDQYLERVSRIHEIPRLTPRQSELAERFAYGLFVLRPFPLETATLEFQRDEAATLRSAINASTVEDLVNARDLRAFADWIATGDEDFINGLEEALEPEGVAGRRSG